MSADKVDRFGATDSLAHGHFSGKGGHSSHPHLFAVKVKLVQAKNSWGKLANIFNPNHRHDEPAEQAVDRRREEEARKHRYKSFAPETEGNEVKWYVDGRDYFLSVSAALERAPPTCSWVEAWNRRTRKTPRPWGRLPRMKWGGPRGGNNPQEQSERGAS